MRKRIVLMAAILLYGVSNQAFSTHLVDCIRVTVMSGSHAISTASFPNGVWFLLPGGVRETVKTSPPFPTLTAGETETRTYNLLTDPDTVVGANFDMSMDGVPHSGGNSYSGASWLARLNQFGDLVGHAPNDADIKYELVLKADPSKALALTPLGLGVLILLIAATGVYYFFRKRKTVA